MLVYFTVPSTKVIQVTIRLKKFTLLMWKFSSNISHGMQGRMIEAFSIP